MKYSNLICFAMIALLLSFTLSCGWSNKAKGTTIGTTAGGTIGGIIGKKAGNTTVGILIGAAVGGTAGYFIGKYMDKQAEEIKKEVNGVDVKRVEEGILLTFDSGLMFDYNSSKLRPATQDDLRELSDILAKYDETEVLLQGHTDATGSDAYNLELSEDRAQAVRNFLAGQGVSSSRFIIEGHGENMPVADNSTQAGRQKNRRVEVAIYANEELKKAAEKGELEAVANNK